MTSKPMHQQMSSYLTHRGYKVWNNPEDSMIRQPPSIFNHNNNNNQSSFNLNSHHLHNSSTHHHDTHKDLEKLNEDSITDEVNEKRRKYSYNLKMTTKPMNRPIPSYLLHRGYKVWNHSEEPIIRQPPSIYNHNKPSLRWNRSFHDFGKLVEETEQSS